LRFSPSPTKTGLGISGWLAIICNRTKESKSLVIRIISSVNFEKGVFGRRINICTVFKYI
jgi:hypothetical protein